MTLNSRLLTTHSSDKYHFEKQSPSNKYKVEIRPLFRELFLSILLNVRSKVKVTGSVKVFRLKKNLTDLIKWELIVSLLMSTKYLNISCRKTDIWQYSLFFRHAGSENVGIYWQTLVKVICQRPINVYWAK